MCCTTARSNIPRSHKHRGNIFFMKTSSLFLHTKSRLGSSKRDTTARGAPSLHGLTPLDPFSVVAFKLKAALTLCQLPGISQHVSRVWRDDLERVACIGLGWPVKKRYSLGDDAGPWCLLTLMYVCPWEVCRTIKAFDIQVVVVDCSDFELLITSYYCSKQ